MKLFHFFRFFVVFLIMTFAVASCAKKKHLISQYPHYNILMAQGLYWLNQKSSNKAIENFKKVAKNYSDQEQSIVAKVMLVWIYYQTGDMPNTKAEAETFLKFYPYNKYYPWVEYILALTSYKRIPNFKRDVYTAYKALELFKDLESKYPSSVYAKDVYFRKILADNVLATRVMNVGRYYLNHKDYLGAAYRFNEIIKLHSRTLYVQEALYRLVEVYSALGDYKNAKNNLIILEYNYPHSLWAKKSKELLSMYKNQGN